MALIVADRVQELTTTSGTGTLTLNGAVSGFQTFSNGIGNTNTTYYTIYDPTAYVWEVGIGTVGAGTLSRDTVLANSLGTTAKINLAGNQASVFCTYPADKSVNLDASGNVTPLGTISSGTWQGTTIGVAYGGTGVTSSSGANSVVLRDSNQNVTVNRLNQSNTTVTAAGGTTALTAASSYSQTLVGTGNQTYTMPDATTLTTGVDFVFNNNATGLLTIRDAASGLLGTVSAGGACAIMLLDNGTVAGTWNLHGFLPESVTWGTNALDLGTTIVSNGTWQGGTIGTAYGGTGLTTFVASNNALFSTSASALTAGTLPVAAGGTGQTSYVNGELLIGNSTGNTLAKSTLTAGTGISITNGSGSITVTNSAPDQTVVLTAGTGISTSGTYPNFTITNSAPDQTVSLTAGSNISITGTYPSFTIAATGGGSAATPTVLGTVYGKTESATPFVTALGYEAGNVSTDVNNTYLGYQAGKATTSANNAFVGYQAGLLNTSGSSNTALGSGALKSNTTNGQNVAVGRLALENNQTGANGVAVGYQALQASTAAGNTAIGSEAGFKITTGSGNTVVGIGAGAALSSSGSGIDLTTGSNNIIIGRFASPSSATVSNEITLGSSSITSFRIPGLSVDWTASTVPNVAGAASSTDNAIARFDGTTGKLIQNSALTVADTTGSLDFTANSARILGNFAGAGSTAVHFQNRGTNQPTFVSAIPSGSGGGAGFVAIPASNLAVDYQYMYMSMSTVGAGILVSRTGAGASFVPFSIEVGGSERLRITTAGGIAFNGSTNYGTSGQVLTSNGDAPPTWVDGVTASSTTTFTNKTLNGAVLNDGYTEEVYAVVDAAGVALSPTNGSIQTWTLGANRTPTAGTWAEGQSITLMINDSASSFTVTWTSLPVTWVGGTAPSLAPASGFTIITLWKVGTTIYGALVGQVT